jgi:membrane-associated HD superfamily phosphohydrolase
MFKWIIGCLVAIIIWTSSISFAQNGKYDLSLEEEKARMDIHIQEQKDLDKSVKQSFESYKDQYKEEMNSRIRNHSFIYLAILWIILFFFYSSESNKERIKDNNSVLAIIILVILGIIWFNYKTTIDEINSVSNSKVCRFYELGEYDCYLWD